jgi:hypothetical protein
MKGLNSKPKDRSSLSLEIGLALGTKDQKPDHIHCLLNITKHLRTGVFIEIILIGGIGIEAFRCMFRTSIIGHQHRCEYYIV